MVLELHHKKYGKENFKKEIIHILESQEEMFAKEQEIVNDEYRDRSDTYNLVTGGMGGKRWSEENKQKRSEQFSGTGNPFHGKTHAKESIERGRRKQQASYDEGYINPFKGKTHSEETKQHWSKIRKGKRKGTENSFFGKEHSKDSKQLISKSWETNKEERCANISEARSVSVNVYDELNQLQHTFKNRQCFNAYCTEFGFPRSAFKCSKDNPYNPTPKRHYPYRGWYVTRG